MTHSIDAGLQDLGRQRPEWEPWLTVVQEVLRETANDRWEAFVPARGGTSESKAPLLAGVTLALEISTVRRWAEQLIRTAYRSGTPKMATLKSAIQAASDIRTLFKASLCQDSERLKETAVILGADPEAFQAVAAFVPVPFLHACNRRWARSIAESWGEGYCPVCGAWPAFAEVRGIERSRHFRCGRCGGQWQVHCLVCPYCGMTDHKELVSLVPEKGGSTRVIEACKRCLGYVKSFTTLQGSPAAKVILDDLASVDLDVAALEQGYRRPQGPGYSLDVTLADNPA
ncbi:MAG: formate dehydrogenase accessory protein FdhE [Deltaproteobacteria bacterium]|nr:MAG: formate dehydrogenase accessory protein FdhE [Deltaproteobacteria bacterium]